MEKKRNKIRKVRIGSRRNRTITRPQNKSWRKIKLEPKRGPTFPCLLLALLTGNKDTHDEKDRIRQVDSKAQFLIRWVQTTVHQEAGQSYNRADWNEIEI